jgi:hypothetical protein
MLAVEHETDVAPMAEFQGKTIAWDHYIPSI